MKCFCGLEVTVGERFTGYLLITTFEVDGRPVDECPRCGTRFADQSTYDRLVAHNQRLREGR